MNEVILWLDFTELIVEAGAKGVVCGPEGAQLADNCTMSKLRECQVSYVHVHFSVSGG